MRQTLPVTAPWKRSTDRWPPAGEAPGHGGHRPVDHGFMVPGQVLVVADGAAAPGDPRQGPLDDPAAGEHLEGVQVIGPPDDLQRQLREGGMPAVRLR